MKKLMGDEGWGGGLFFSTDPQVSVKTMTFYERSELFRKYPKTPVFDHSNYRLFERIPAVPGTSNNRGLTV